MRSAFTDFIPTFVIVAALCFFAFDLSMIVSLAAAAGASAGAGAAAAPMAAFRWPNMGMPAIGAGP